MEYILIIGSGICGLTDVLYRKIPNIITYPLLLIAFGINTYNGRFVMALIGLFVAFVIGFVGFISGQMGAGDVKLMSALGAGFGLGSLLHILLIASLTGLFYITLFHFIKLIKEKQFKSRFITAKMYILNHNMIEVNMLQKFIKRKDKHHIPFGTCLFIGVIIINLYF